MAGPWLIGVAIDTAIPDALHGDNRALAFVTVSLAAAAVLSGWLRSVFVLRSGRIGQAILFDLRRRGYDHAQALSVSFHERYTSGRIISRLTSDIDTLTELLDSGLDGLITAAFNIVAIMVLLVVLDVPLALIALGSLVPDVVPVPVVLQARDARLPPHAHRGGRRHRRHRRDVQRHPRRAGLRPRELQRRQVRGAEPGLPRGQPARVQAARRVHPGHDADRQPGHGVGARRRRLPGGRRRAGARRAHRVPALPVAVLRPDGRRRGVLQLAAVGHRGAGEDRHAAGAGAVGAGAGGAGAAARAGARPRRVRRRVLRLPRRPPGAAVVLARPSRPARRWRSSAPPAPARPPSPG